MSVREIETKWYSVRTLAGKERAAKENIEREVKMNNIDKWVVDVVLPTEKMYKLRNGKKFSREKLVFPGYLFIELQLIGEVERIIKNTKFVIGFTGDRKNNPEALKQREIDRIIGRMKIEESGEVEIPFIVGEEIKINDGAFDGFVGSIETIDEDKKMLEVIVKIFGRSTPVKLSYLQVDKV